MYFSYSHFCAHATTNTNNMKYLILSMLLIFSGVGFSQEGLSTSDPNEAAETRVPYEPDFDATFVDEDDLNNFKKLRLYLKKKQNIVDRQISLAYDSA